jgi:branched-chain amino acid aminotransferase
MTLTTKPTDDASTMPHAHPAGAGRASKCYYQGAWHDGPTPLMDSDTNATWMANTVFDGARAFAGVVPDLALHCQRIIRSALSLGMKPPVTAAEIEALAREGIRRFPAETELYVRPMFWIQAGAIPFDADSTRFALVLSPDPLPPATGFSATLSPYRRPSPDQAPTQAKAACLYPMSTLAVVEARSRGFGNAVMRSPDGTVAEFATQNLWLVKDGVYLTPVPNGCFLAGITRARVLQLLRDAGHRVEERVVKVEELHTADEIFSTGNHGKVLPLIRYEDRALTHHAATMVARSLYFEFAKSQPI